MPRKNTPRRITVSEMAPHVHSFQYGENKVNKISKWLMAWIEEALKSGRAKPYDFLPSKAELACHIGVSQGTMQNAFRNAEDMGYIESKQRVGTFIKDKKGENSVEKLTSKKDFAVEVIKKYITENSYKEGDILISIRKLSGITGISPATLGIAAGSLVSAAILGKKNNSFVVLNLSFKVNLVETRTLAEKFAERLEGYIDKNLKSGDKLPSNTELAHMFNISVKTIHDSIKILAKKGILHPRRGKYGTIVISESEKLAEEPYYYEKTAQKIRSYISENCQTGDKLPSILNFSQIFKVSPKTVKRALDNLADDGYITFTRGRCGGTFVTDIPQPVEEAYAWLALNTEYLKGN